MSWSIPSLPSWSWSPSSSTPKEPPIDDPEAETEEDKRLDEPPPIPFPSSAQRAIPISNPYPPPRPTRQQPLPPPSFSFAPPSPSKSDPDRDPPSDVNIAILPSSVPLGNMPPPPSTTARPVFGIQPGGGGGDTILPKSKGRKGKVALDPGHSALDWSRLSSSGQNLRGTDTFPLRVTMAELKTHNTKKDAWVAFNGKVYSMTRYMRYHPGGEDQLMRCAGRDGTKLFMLTHSWVNVDIMFQECMVGMLVRG